MRDDLVDIVGQRENTITGLLEPMRDLLRALDEMLMIDHMKEQLPHLLLRETEFGLIGELGVRLGQLTEVEAPPETSTKQCFGALAIFVGAFLQIEAAFDDLRRRPPHEDV